MYFFASSIYYQKKTMSNNSYVQEYSSNTLFFFTCTCIINASVCYISNRIGGVMVSVLASSAINLGFESRSGQTKHYKIDMCCFFAKHAALRRKSKDLVGSKSGLMCSNGATCLFADCCFSKLAI